MFIDDWEIFHCVKPSFPRNVYIICLIPNFEEYEGFERDLMITFCKWALTVANVPIGSLRYRVGQYCFSSHFFLLHFTKWEGLWINGQAQSYMKFNDLIGLLLVFYYCAFFKLLFYLPHPLPHKIFLVVVVVFVNLFQCCTVKSNGSYW